MLAFDIETEGLDKYTHRITVACVLDPDRGISESFVFLQADQDACRSSVERFLQHLDEAEMLCAYNGARFDIPFIVHQFRVPHSRYSKWLVKLFDYFEACRLILSSTCSLNELLLTNGIQCKTSSGTQAVVWAQQGQWRDLCDYCMSDTALTHALCSKPVVSLPVGRGGHQRTPGALGSQGPADGWVECHKKMVGATVSTGQCEGTHMVLAFRRTPQPR